MSEPTSFIDFQLLLIEMERDRDKWKDLADRFALAVEQGKPVNMRYVLWLYNKVADRGD